MTPARIVFGAALLIVVGLGAYCTELDDKLTSIFKDWEVRHWVFRKESFLFGAGIVVSAFSYGAYKRAVWPEVIELVSLVGWLGVMWGALQLFAVVYFFETYPSPDPVTAFAATAAVLWLATREVLRALTPFFTPSTVDPMPDAEPKE